MGEELRGRTVECGGCEHRFKIEDDVIVRAKKVYPGERSDPALTRFQRVPMAGGEALIGGGTRYSDAPDPAVMEPMSPQRIIAGLVGSALMIITAIAMMFGSSRGGMFDGMDIWRRLILVGFVSILGLILIIYANPKAKLKAGMFGLLLAAGTVAVPFLFTVGSDPLPKSSDNESDRVPVAPLVKELTDAEVLQAKLKEEMNPTPLENEQKKLEQAGEGKVALGVWLRDMRDSHRLAVRDYLLRVSGASLESHIYPRPNSSYFMVLSGATSSFVELTAEVQALGTVKNTYPEMSVIEVEVNHEIFEEGPIEKLSNRNDPAFYELNKLEMESIDLSRVRKAVQRLVDVEPKFYRADITKSLIELLKEDTVDFKDVVCSALIVWAETPGPAGEAALPPTQTLLDKNFTIPQSMIELLVKEKTPGAVPILNRLWHDDPTRWESFYGDFGSGAESSILKDLPETSGILRHSAIRILGRIGGASSTTVLRQLAAGTDSEQKVLIEQALKSISSRGE